MFDGECKKCKKKKFLLNHYGFCEPCHSKFIPYLREALRKFLKSGNRKGTGKKSWITRRKDLK